MPMEIFSMQNLRPVTYPSPTHGVRGPAGRIDGVYQSRLPTACADGSQDRTARMLAPLPTLGLQKAQLLCLSVPFLKPRQMFKELQGPRLC